MKIKLLTVIAFFVSHLACAQAPKVEWVKAIGGTGNERANSVVTDSKGNVILVGRFQSPTIMMDNITLKKSTADTSDVADLFILKLDKKENAIWIRN